MALAEQIAALRALSAPYVAEIVSIYFPSPTGTKHYSTTHRDMMQPTSTLPATIEPRVIPNSVDSYEYFQSVTIASGIADDEIEITFDDTDGAFSDLMELHGEGIRVVLSYWFPAEDLLLEHFWGHLRTAEGADETRFPVKVASGFRSPQSNMPRRRHNQEGSCIFGGLFTTQAEIDENDCPFNAHLTGGTIGNNDPLTGLPYTSCPHRTREDCEARLGPFPSADLPTSGNRLNYHQITSHQSIQGTIVNNQTVGPNLLVSGRGNESNLKRPVRVVMGLKRIRNLDLLQYAPQTNTGNPNDGFVRVLFEACEGPVRKINEVRVNGTLMGPADWQDRGGEIGQPPTTFLNQVNNYSATAHFYAVWGRVNPANYGPQNLSAEAIVYGLRNLRIYSDEETFIREWTENRAWHLMEMLTNKRWGFGYDHARCAVQSFIDTSVWADKTVTFTDPDGTTWTSVRALSGLDLTERATQQHVNELCTAGCISPPFLSGGKIKIVPLAALTEDELGECPVFTDDLSSTPNIIREANGKSTLKRFQTSDVDLVNEVTVTFEEAIDSEIEKSITVRDQQQQIKAGSAAGDVTRRVVEKKYGLMGVRYREHAVRMAWRLLDLGALDSGGLRNNLKIKFKAWFLDCLTLHPYKVIKVLSDQLTRYKEPLADGTLTEDSFQYFRVMKIKRLPNLVCEIEAQAYNKNYMDEFETESGTLGGGAYEAEDATLAGGANAVHDDDCSNGEKVTDIGLGGTVLFDDIYAAEAGYYPIRIYYKSTSDTVLFLTVNGLSAQPVPFPDSGGAVAFVEIARLLQASGANTLLFANSAAAGPDLDKLEVGLLILDDGDTGGCLLEFGAISYEKGKITVPIEPC